MNHLPQIPERFYHFYFSGHDAPITVLAVSKIHAEQIMSSNPLPPAYEGLLLDGITTSQPLEGISTMKDGDKTLVWVGRQNSQSGWAERKE